jgi:hypothetical protein
MINNSSEPELFTADSIFLFPTPPDISKSKVVAFVEEALISKGYLSSIQLLVSPRPYSLIRALIRE